MQLDPNKTLEDNYRGWLQSVKDDANFFADAWAHSAEKEEPSPKASKRLLKQLQPELPSSYTVDLEDSVDNVSRLIFQQAREQVQKDSDNRKW